MKKERTYTKTIASEEYFCDVCGKKLTKKEEKCWSPYAILNYARWLYNGKSEDDHADCNSDLDLCEECNEKVVDVVLNYFDEYAFMEYCAMKYKTNWSEEVRYYLWI